MNLNQIVNMVIRTVMRRAVTKGVNLGIDTATGLARRPEMAEAAPPRHATQDDAPDVAAKAAHGRAVARQQRQARQAQRAAKQAIRMARRMGRG